MSALPIIEHEESTQLALLPMPTIQPHLLTLEEADQALETAEIVIEQVERVVLQGLALRIHTRTMQAVQALEELRQKAAQLDYPLWKLEQARDSVLTPAREVRSLVRTYTKRLAKQPGQ